jgi:serine/threonine protein kinase
MNTCSSCQRSFVDDLRVCPLDGGGLVSRPGLPPENLGRVLGTYRLVGLLGEGGMGTIYIGAHTRLDRYVAIKILRPELARRHENVARFFDEARTINGLAHPNIIESIDMVDDPVDGAYCVLELLRGPSLKELLADGALPIGAAIHIAVQLAGALSAVHAQGIVHRDLKPDNLILVERDDDPYHVKLIDFGVAQMSNASSDGAPYGTAAYMAPEQAAGERVDGRADIYALGVLLFEMVTGIHPFPSATDHEYTIRHAHDDVPRVSAFARVTISPLLDRIVETCLAKQPEHRYATAAEVVSALYAIHSDERERVRGRKWAWAAAALVVAAAAGVIALVSDSFIGLPTPPQVVASPSPPTPPQEPPAAAPPPVVPTPTPAPAAPKEIELGFESQPAGASVLRRGESVPLCTTPCTIPILRSDRTMHVQIALDGYKPFETEVTASAPSTVTATLEPLRVARATKRPPAARPRPEPATKKPMQREGVVNPFEKRSP